MSKRNPAVYLIINTINGHLYVGSAVNYKKRFNNHFSDLRKNIHHSTYLQRAYNLYTEAAFQALPLEKLESEDALVPREQYWIDLLNPEYNISKTAGSALGCKRSDETREKMSKAATGRPMPQKTREAIRNANVGRTRPYKPANFSPDLIEQKRSDMLVRGKEMRKLWSLTPEGRKRLSDLAKQRVITEAEKLKISDKNSIAVLQYDLDGNFIKEWKSARQAFKDLNISYKNICTVCQGKRRSAGGFAWKYKHDIIHNEEVRKLNKK